MNQSYELDAQRARQSADLVAIAGKSTDLKKVGARFYSGPCPSCGGTDRFVVKIGSGIADHDRWLCRHCSPHYNDAIEFLRWLHGLSFRKAVLAIDSSAINDTLPRLERKPELPKQFGNSAPKHEWQAPAIQAAFDCAERLQAAYSWIQENAQGEQSAEFWKQSPPAVKAYRYLQNRGLSHDTIRDFMLGYNPEWCKYKNAGKLAPGITIPSFAGQASDIYYLKVRTFRANLDKYMYLRGSKAGGLFNANRLLSARYVIVTEGEFDALLLGQYLPPLWAAVTLGSAAAIPSRYWQYHFAMLRAGFTAHDADEAGQNGAAKWRELLPWLKPMPAALQPNEDITDFWKRGGDISAWIRTAIESIE